MTRGEILRGSYRRQWRFAVLASVILHAALLVLFRDAPFLLHRWQAPSSPVIGYPGPTRVLELAPLEEIISTQESLARQRTSGGALVYEEVTLRQETTRPEHPAPFAEQRAEPRPRTPDRMVVPAKPIIIELGEDWQARRSSKEPAFSEQFQVLSIVRPEYPEPAIWGQIQGLVKLEVQVGATGNVLGVRVIENTSGSSLLEQASTEAMFRWKFRPYRVESGYVPFTILVPFRFRLEPAPAGS